MSESFDRALDHVLAWEGGLRLVKLPGEDFMTFAGINQKAHPEWPGWERLGSDMPPLDDEQKKTMVKDFYLGLWRMTRAETTGVEQDYFDTSVLQGPRIALKLLQRMHNILSQETLAVDGIWSDFVMFKLGQLNMQVSKEIRTGVYQALRQAHLIGLVEANQAFERFAWGWIRRARGDKP